jgi:DNA-binding NarL/FixJ family response regulator
VLIADDHALLRTGLRRLLGEQPDLEVVGEAGDVASTITLARSCTPDVVLLDLAMPGGGGLVALRALRDACPETRVLAVTMYDDRAHLQLALAAGASGYVTKAAPPAELITAIRAVSRGRMYLSECLDDRGPAPPAAADAGGGRELTAREREILRLVAQGHTSKEIAEINGLSFKTVEGYRARLMHRLGLNSRAELVSYVVSAGLLDEPPGSPRD